MPRKAPREPGRPPKARALPRRPPRPTAVRAPDGEDLAQFAALARVSGITLATRSWEIDRNTGYRWLRKVEADAGMLARCREVEDGYRKSLAPDYADTVRAALAAIRADLAEGVEPRKNTLRAALLLGRAMGGGSSPGASAGDPPADTLVVPAGFATPRPETPAPTTDPEPPA